MKDTVSMEEGNRSTAQFPGAHCGLFEAAIMAPLFPSSAALVIAPPSCLYHAKILGVNRHQAPSYRKDNLYLLSLKQEDMVFGVDCVIEDSLLELDQQVQPEVIFLISTCTPEIIGFDKASISPALKEQLNAKVLVVETNGYSCLHRQKGTSDFLVSLLEVMQPREVLPLTVNILGLRSHKWDQAELVQVLERSGVCINSVLPGANQLNEIERAPAAALNIVIGKAAIPLAKKMQEQFGTPFLHYDYSYETEQIIQGYETIGSCLGVDLTQKVKQMANEHVESIVLKKKMLEGVSFAIGSVDGSNIEAAAFLTKMGMIPKFIQTRIPIEKENPFALELKERGIDLPIIYLSHTSRLEELINQYRPEIFLGHGVAEMLYKANVSHFHPGSHLSGPGFGFVEQLVETLGDFITCKCRVDGESYE